MSGIITSAADAQRLQGTKPGKWQPMRFTLTAEEAIKLASMVRDHQHLVYMLLRCAPEDRTIMYEALRPHLKFKAFSLDEYISGARARADAEKLPTLNEDGTLSAYEDYNPTKRPLSVLAEKAITEAVALAKAGGRKLTVICAKCTTEAEFVGETLVAATIAARKAGWVYDAKNNSEICPKCPAVRLLQ